MQVLSEFNFASRMPRSSKYDWETILNGSINKLERGTDYTCQSLSFRSQIRNVAVKLGGKVKTKIIIEQPESIVVQFIGA